MTKGKGTPDDPWVLQTPSGQSEFEIHRDPDADPPALVCRVGKAELRGRFGNYVPPVLEILGLAELEHQPRNDRMRAI